MNWRSCISSGRHASMLVVMTISLSGLLGCEEAREEKVLDIEAPGVDIEVNKTEGEDGVEAVEIEAGSTE